MLTVKAYKTIDLYDFFRLCLHINQTLRDVENESRSYRRSESIESSIELTFELIEMTTSINEEFSLTQSYFNQQRI
jgi:hypothetical protein